MSTQNNKIFEIITEAISQAVAQEELQKQLVNLICGYATLDEVNV